MDLQDKVYNKASVLVQLNLRAATDTVYHEILEEWVGLSVGSGYISNAGVMLLLLLTTYGHPLRLKVIHSDLCLLVTIILSG